MQNRAVSRQAMDQAMTRAMISGSGNTIGVAGSTCGFICSQQGKCVLDVKRDLNMAGHDPGSGHPTSSAGYTCGFIRSHQDEYVGHAEELGRVLQLQGTPHQNADGGNCSRAERPKNDIIRQSDAAVEDDRKISKNSTNDRSQRPLHRNLSVASYDGPIELEMIIYEWQACVVREDCKRASLSKQRTEECDDCTSSSQTRFVWCEDC